MSCKYLYYDYHRLFNSESSALRERVKQEQLVTSIKALPDELIQPSAMKQKFLLFFLGMTDFSRNTFDIQTKIGIVSKEESTHEINQAYTALAAMGAFLTLMNPKKTYEESKKRHQFFAAQGIEPPKTNTTIAIEALSEHKKDLFILVASNIATGLLIIPDVTTVFTKGAAAGIFILIGLYNTVRTLYAASQTQQRLTALRSFKPQEDDKEKTYKDFIDEVLSKEIDQKLIEALLNAGEELQAADLNLQTTQLTNQEWKALVEKTLSFKRNCQIMNAIRTIFSSIALLFTMIPSTVALATAKLATYLASFAPQSAIAGRITSISLLVSAMIQEFSQFSLFKRFVFKKLADDTQKKLKIAEPVFSKKEIKALFYRFNSESAARFALKIKALELTNTLILLQKMKDNDPLLAKHPTLKEKLDHLRDGLMKKHVLKEDDQIQEIQAIADMIGSVPAITPTQRFHLGDLLKGDDAKFELIFTSNELTRKPLLAYSEESQGLIRTLRAAIAHKNEPLILNTLKQLSSENPPTPAPERVFTKNDIQKFRKATKGHKLSKKFDEIIAWINTLTTDHSSLKEENSQLIQRLKSENTEEIIRNQLILVGNILKGTLSDEISATSTSINRDSAPFAQVSLDTGASVDPTVTTPRSSA
jgi:hypothetical protein